MYSLARGDAFKKEWHKRLLHKLKLLPVYRTSEGVENLEHNYTTFAACREVFRDDGIVLIFSEGRCINEWKLRPLKKGTARLAVQSWFENIDLTVLPVALNYNPFRNFGKNVFVNFGEPLDKEAVLEHSTDGKLLAAFNVQLHHQLRSLVYHIPKADYELQEKRLSVPVPFFKSVLLFPFAVAGFMLHAPIYFIAKAITYTFFNNDHFDSAVASMLLLFYPFFLIAVFIVVGVTLGWFLALFSMVLLPLSAYAAIQLKPQI